MLREVEVLGFLKAPEPLLYILVTQEILDKRGGGEKLEGVEGGETISRIYYMRKEYIFQGGNHFILLGVWDV